MGLFDSHAHPHFAAYKDDSDEVIRRARERGVQMLVVGTHIDTSRTAIATAERYDGVRASIGLHPIHVTDGYFDPNEDSTGELRGQTSQKSVFRRRGEVYDREAYRALAQSSPKVVAIGECGLDYYRLEGEEESKEQTKQRQREVFRQQVELAAELDLALSVHCRNSSPAAWAEKGRLQTALPTRGGDVSLNKDAQADVYEILKSVQAEHPNLRGVIHCFTGTAEEAARHRSLGFLISFPGIITFAHDWDSLIRELPLEAILIETDCPYLTPVPHRGKRNEPAYVEFTARHLAALKGVPFEEVAEVTTNNAQRLFKIKK